MSFPDTSPPGASMPNRSLAGAVERLHAHVDRVGRQPTHAGERRPPLAELVIRPLVRGLER